MILVFAEQRNGELRRPALECVSEARRIADKLGSKVCAVVIGHNVNNREKLAEHGADDIVSVNSPIFARYSDGYAKAFFEVAQKRKPAAIILPASSMGRDIAPRIAALLDVPVASDCIDVHVDGGKIIVKRPIFAGKALLTVSFLEVPAIITLKPNVFSVSHYPKHAKSEEFVSSVTIESIKSRVTESISVHGGKKDLTEADIIVSGGRGLGGPEKYAILEELAGVLGGVVGASRAAVDAGWRPHSDQVGQTGKIVAPKLYIACGISGAIQHQVGMKNSKCIVAINKDPEAPIFKITDYGLVGDLFEIVPALTEEIKKARGLK